ncbi:amidohydrolase [Fluviibacterium sp. DFM31]|uniref:Amidohydrolase n=1 Tax=Meridianimarinicoccus marinus TaxID=3231483 RepID=A0ABV3LAQ6_9RHOB
MKFQTSLNRRAFLSKTAAAGATCFAPAVFTRPAWAQESADVLFSGGTIITMNQAGPQATALAVRGGRIVAVGDAAELEGLRGSNTRLVDLDGRTMTPGFIDPHMHSASVQVDSFVDCGIFTNDTFDDVLDKLRASVAETPPGEWVYGANFDPVLIKGARVPTLAELDALSPDNPFLLLESNGHVAYTNTLGFQAVGMTRDTPNPPTSRIVRDADGNLTGRLEEPPAFVPLLAAIPQPTAEENAARVRALFDKASANGVTAMQDMSIGLLTGGRGDIDILNAIMADAPPLRYRGALQSTQMGIWDEMGITPNQGDDMLRFNKIKAWSDGSNQGYSGFQRDNYLGKDTRGALNYTQEELFAVVRDAHNAGWDVAIHANGDAAIDVTLDVYEDVRAQSPDPDRRHTIQHASVLRPEHIDRMVALGVSPSFLIGHVRWWGKAFRDEILGPERAKFYDPVASAIAAGLPVSFHSDYNVTPLGPLRMVQDAVTRIMADGGDVFFADERVSPDLALRGVTIDAAYQSRIDDICGSLEVGKYADLAILEDDPTQVSPLSIEKIKVSETWLAGEQKLGA